MDQYDVDERVEKFEESARSALMKLFMSACKNSREQRAYEIATVMDSQALHLAIKYATKTRALNLAQNLNILAERKAEIEAAAAKLAQANVDDEEYSYFNNMSNHVNNNTVESIRPSGVVEDTQNEVAFEKVTQASRFSNHTPKLNDTTNSQAIALINESGVADSTYKTPVLTPMTAMSRLNPFAKNNLSGKISQTPSNDTPKSVLNKIEEKLLQQSGGDKAEKAAAWKPISTKKLTMKPK